MFSLFINVLSLSINVLSLSGRILRNFYHYTLKFSSFFFFFFFKAAVSLEKGEVLNINSYTSVHAT